MDAAALRARTSSVVMPPFAGGSAVRQPAASPSDIAAAPQAGDTVALSDVATSLSGEARELFAAFSGEDRTRLAQLVESGAVSAQELGDGLTGALKGSRKLQLWQGVFNAINESGARAEFEAERAERNAVQIEIDKLQTESERVFKEMTQSVGEPQLPALSQKKGEQLRALHDQMRALQEGALMDLTKPTTFVGTSGTFLSANWQMESERSAQDKLEKLGVFSASVKDVITAASKKAAQENMIVRHII
jgi:hypothetical protein